MEIKNYFSLICILVLLPVRVAFLYGQCGVKSTTVTTLMLLLLMLSCLTCALTPTNEDEITFIECGDIVPVDPYYFIGERVVLTCTIWNIDNNKTVSLYFDTAEYNNGKWSNFEVNQTGYEIIQLNSTTIQLTSPVLTIDDARRHNVTRSYRCMVREVVNNCTERSKKFVRNEHVKIDYYPHNPENFSCQVYNWEKLTCTWDMIPYFHKDDITVECFWKNDLESGDSRTWGSEFSTKNFTSFTMDNFNMMPKYWFYFNITNVVRSIVNNSAIFDINPSKIVKPAPVDFISFQNINDTCVTVVWNHSKRHRKQVFRVRYTSNCSSEQQITTQEMNITVCDLNPFTNYTFVVDSRPVDLDSEGNSLDTVGFTSEPRDSLVTTKSAVPAANPKLLSYTDVPCPERQCRKVLVYWKPVSPCDLHDSLSGQWYEIITNQIGSLKTSKDNTDSTAISHSVTLPDDNKAYDVKLRVITGSGKKREDFSHLVIWARNQSPIAPSMVVEYDTMMNGTNFYITLSLTEAQSQTSQILYWCRLRGILCQEAMSFREMNGSSEEIFIGNYEMDFNIKFGVESQQNSSGEITRSGIQMASCFYKKDEKPLIPPKNFHIAKGIAEREGELSLQWDPYDCNSPEIESGYVLSYTLYYCQVIDESSCDFNDSMHDLNEISIKQDIHNYTVRKLKPGGRYKVWLTARTSAGEGPPTDAVDTYIYLQEFPLWAKVMIGVGSLIASLVILICVVKFQHYLKSRRNAFSLIEVPDTRMPVMNGYDYVQIRLPNGKMPNGHVIVDDQSDEPIPDMDESEELSRIILLIPNGNAQVSVTNNSSSNSLSLDLGQSDPIKSLLDMPFFGSDHKNYGPYISSIDMTSTCSDIESDIDTKNEKEMKLGALVLAGELGHQNANLLPEDYCTAVVNGDYVPNSETNPVLYEDRLDNKFLKMQGQAVHSQSIDSLLNDGSELQRPNIIILDDCKGNICDRDKDIDSVCVKDSSNLPQENVTIEKQIELDGMKSKDDSESDDLALSHDDDADALSVDSLSLFDVICRSLDKKTSGYVPAHEVHDDGEPLLNSMRHAADTHLDEISLGSDNGHVRSETAGMRSVMDNMRPENDLVRSADDKIIPTDFVKCDDCTVITNDNSVKAMGDPWRSGDNSENSCVESLRTFVFPGTLIDDSLKVDDYDSTVINHNQNIVQNGVPDNQQKVDMVTFLSQNENNGNQIEKHPLRKNSAMPYVSNVVRNGLVRLPLDTSLLKKVGKDGASKNGYW